MKTVSVMTIFALLMMFISTGLGLRFATTGNVDFFLTGVIAGLASITLAIISFRD